MIEATIGGAPIPDQPDLARMGVERSAKLHASMRAEQLDAVVLLSSGACSYAAGCRTPAVDSSRAVLMRTVVIVRADDPLPHLFTPYPEGAPPDLPLDHVHPALYPDLDDGAAALVRAVRDVLPRAGATVGVDDLPFPLARALSAFTLVGAGTTVASAKLRKTPDELACLRTAQRITEAAMSEVQPLLRAGVTQHALTAAFVGSLYSLGPVSNGIDPVWQAMPRTQSAGPWTADGEVAFPTASTGRVLDDGDVVWVDAGVHYQGYASDFGRTWLVGQEEPSKAQASQYRRWRTVIDATLAVCRPGATGLALTEAAIAAADGARPWLKRFYLSHGVGTDNAEAPLIGTDLGERHDEQIVLEPGMILVLEPVIWDEGNAGYRAEDIYVITDAGWACLSNFPYAPFGLSGVS